MHPLLFLVEKEAKYILGESKGRGRPKKDEAKSRVYKLRVGAEESEMLDYLSYKDDVPKAEVIRNALKMYYNFKKYTD